MIEIPLERLSTEILTAIIEEFILRDGTDYGAQEASMDSKITQVQRQLVRGDVLITFDPVTENCTLLTKHQFQRYQDEHKMAEESDQSSIYTDAEAYDHYSQDTGYNSE
ncbi:MAG: YheU family protein [Porticoccaceae bacterium]